jgi:hypothetical protein
MATKNNPGDYDCYANAEPDEPMFVLLGRDPCSYFLVRMWIHMRHRLAASDEAQLREAGSCARSMRDWAMKLGKHSFLAEALSAFEDACAKVADPTSRLHGDDDAPTVATNATTQHPMQPVVLDPHGTPRFKQNAIVRFLLDNGPFDLNKLARMEFSQEDQVQFAQLIGYSVGGFGELPYVTDEAYDAADEAAEDLLDKVAQGLLENSKKSTP